MSLTRPLLKFTTQSIAAHMAGYLQNASTHFQRIACRQLSTRKGLMFLHLPTMTSQCNSLMSCTDQRLLGTPCLNEAFCGAQHFVQTWPCPTRLCCANNTGYLHPPETLEQPNYVGFAPSTPHRYDLCISKFSKSFPVLTAQRP